MTMLMRRGATSLLRGKADMGRQALSIPSLHQISSSSTVNGENDHASVQSLHDFRNRLLEASLTKVPTLGWSNKAIASAATDLSKEGSVCSLASAGLVTVPELISYVMDQSNLKLQKELEDTKWDEEQDTSASKIAWAIHYRLGLLKDLVKSNRWHEGMALGARPQSVVQTQAQLKQLIDSIANSIESSMSTAERLSLGAIYVASELHMLADTSTDFRDTHVFIQQRVAEWDGLRKAKFDSISSNASDVVWTATRVGAAFLSGTQSIFFSQPSSPTFGTRSSHYEPKSNAQ